MADTLRDLVQLAVVVDERFDQNCYIVRRRDSDAALVIDPGLQGARATRVLEDAGLSPTRILITHGHPDHVSGIPAVKARFGCPAAIHPEDRPYLDYAGMVPGIPSDIGPIECEEDLIPDAVWRWEELDVAVIATPGHTPGSVCFLIGPDLIAGDTLFQRGVGRTDLPGGDWATLMFSIENHLYTLPPETIVHPGHGPSTTIREEMQHNPFLVHPKYR